MKKLFTLIATALVALGVNAATTGTISATDTWTVCGGSPLITPAWDPTATENDMTANGDGSYTLVKKDLTLAAGIGYEWKVVQNHDWANLNYGDPTNLNDSGEPNNIKLFVPEDGVYTVTFTVTPGENALEVTPTAKADMTSSAEIEHTYVVAGSSAALFGPTWNGTEETNKMTLCEDEADPNFGLYVLTKNDVTLDAGDIEYKVVIDGGTWIPDANQILKIDSAGKYTVTFTLDAATQAISGTATKTGEAGEITHKYVVAGGVQGTGDAGFFGDSWSGTSEKNEMTKQADGTYELVIKDAKVETAPVTYEYKVVEDGGTWYGNDGTTAGGNYTLDIAEAGTYNVTFDFDPATKLTTAKYDKTADGINAVKTVTVNTDNRIFNLAGQQVSKAYKGVVICNGKKYIQK